MKLFRAAVLLGLLSALVSVNHATAQSRLAGSVGGRVTDPTGAVVPNSVVSLKSLETGETQSTSVGRVGFERFSLVFIASALSGVA
jgi:hypothetical protein